MKATIKLVEDYRGTGSEVIALVLDPESTADIEVARAVSIGVPPEGNILGWIEGKKIVLETESQCRR